jgi:hypothetical protein
MIKSHGRVEENPEETSGEEVKEPEDAEERRREPEFELLEAEIRVLMMIP